MVMTILARRVMTILGDRMRIARPVLDVRWFDRAALAVRHVRRYRLRARHARPVLRRARSSRDG